jgi:hypothetical protein
MYLLLLRSSSSDKDCSDFLYLLLVFAGWQAGFETVYAKLVVGTTNAVVGVVKADTHIEIEKTTQYEAGYQFKVFTRINGRKASYPQEPGSLLQPFVIILSWQIFLFFVLKRKSALQSLLVNFGLFILIQVIFMILLTGYYNSDVQQYIYTMMMDSFYIIALVFVIKDYMLYPVFVKKDQPKRTKK